MKNVVLLWMQTRWWDRAKPPQMVTDSGEVENTWRWILCASMEISMFIKKWWLRRLTGWCFHLHFQQYLFKLLVLSLVLFEGGHEPIHRSPPLNAQTCIWLPHLFHNIIQLVDEIFLVTPHPNSTKILPDCNPHLPNISKMGTNLFSHQPNSCGSPTVNDTSTYINLWPTLYNEVILWLSTG